jgi:hypothetical protein
MNSYMVRDGNVNNVRPNKRVITGVLQGIQRTGCY